MSDKRFVYTIKNGKSVNGLVNAVKTMLVSSEKMEVQKVSGDNTAYTVLQARTAGGKAKQFVGMDKAITIRFICEKDREVSMEIGEAKWVDKGVVMAVSMFVLAPLAITSGIGMYKQHKLPEKIRLAADEYMDAEARLTYVEPKRTIGDRLNDVANSQTAQKIAAEAPKIISKIIR